MSHLQQLSAILNQNVVSMRASHHRRCRLNESTHRGITLIELLVVISIIGLLTSMLLPAVQQAREAARRTDCLSRMRQIATALHKHHEVRCRFPAGTVIKENQNCGICWTIAILPYLEEQPLFDKYDNYFDNDAPENRTVRMTHVAIYSCPDDPRIGVPTVPTEKASSTPSNTTYMPGSYRGVSGRSDGKFFLDSKVTFGYNLKQRGILHVTGVNGLHPEVFAAIRDGASNTLLVGESVTQTRPGMGTLWANSYLFYIISAVTPQSRTMTGDYQACIAQPGYFGQFPCKRGWGSVHGSVVNFALADSSVRSISTAVDMELLARMATMMGGEVVGPPE